MKWLDMMNAFPSETRIEEFPTVNPHDWAQIVRSESSELHDVLKPFGNPDHEFQNASFHPPRPNCGVGAGTKHDCAV